MGSFMMTMMVIMENDLCLCVVTSNHTVVVVWRGWARKEREEINIDASIFTKKRPGKNGCFITQD